MHEWICSVIRSFFVWRCNLHCVVVSAFAIQCQWIPWCSGYHVCLTHRRSPVRSRVESTAASDASLPFSCNIRQYVVTASLVLDLSRRHYTQRAGSQFGLVIILVNLMHVISLHYTQRVGSQFALFLIQANLMHEWIWSIIFVMSLLDDAVNSRAVYCLRLLFEVCANFHRSVEVI